MRIVLAGALTLVAAAADSAARRGSRCCRPTASITTAQQVVIGVAMGFALQLMFDALTLGGQLLANGMGLGFAFTIDPLRGVEHAGARAAVLLLGTLTFLALDGHIALIETLVGKLSRPAGRARRASSPQALQPLANWGSTMFLGALRIALPGMTALLVINLAFGVISRAAPALNLFAVGLPGHAGVRPAWCVLLGLPSMQTGLIDSWTPHSRSCALADGGAWS